MVWVFLCYLLLTCVSCSKNTIQVYHNDILPRISQHVVVIGLDGFNFDKDYILSNYININDLILKGACTFHKRSVIPSSSAINWASTLMGVPPEMHGYTEWGSKTPEVPSAKINENGIFPTVFSLCRNQFPFEETGCMFEWSGIKYLIDTLSISFVKQLKPDVDSIESNVEIICQYLQQNKPFFFFCQIDGIDHTGHTNGWYSEEYYSYIARVDHCIGLIIQTLKNAGIYDDTIIIIVSDHGGHSNNHGTVNLLDMESPLIICGKGIKNGYIIQEPVVQYDIAPTIAYLLGLKPYSYWRGKVISEIFQK